MQRLLSLGTLAVLGGLGWLFASNFKIEGLEQVAVKGREKLEALRGDDPPDSSEFPYSGTPASQASMPLPSRPAPSVARDGETIKIASYNIQVFGDSKASKPHVMNVLASIVQRFDLVAIQEIRTKQGEYLIREFVNKINSQYNRHYEFLIGPRLGRTNSKEQYAFIFDAASIEVDRSQAYTINAPPEMIHRAPLVAQFRVRGPPPEHAFTFTLVNVHTDPDEAQEEVDVLADAYRVVRQASGGEDDIIILGDLNVDDRHLGRLGQLPDMYPVIQNQPTNTRLTSQYDNIVLHRPSTLEFTGRGGVLDVMRAYNLTTTQVLDVSDHLPVWAEFSLYEQKGTGGRVATRPGEWPR